MASGVYRPYTLADVLGTLNDQQTQDTGSVTGVGLFTEADETPPITESVTATVQVQPGWDGGVWGALSWS